MIVPLSVSSTHLPLLVEDHITNKQHACIRTTYPCLYHSQEGKELLGDEELEKTRGQTEALKEAVQTSSPQKPHVPRDNTMVATAQVNISPSPPPSYMFIHQCGLS